MYTENLCETLIVGEGGAGERKSKGRHSAIGQPIKCGVVKSTTPYLNVAFHIWMSRGTNT